MKKLLAIFLATLSITTFARENITLAYSWTAADGELHPLSSASWIQPCHVGRGYRARLEYPRAA